MTRILQKYERNVLSREDAISFLVKEHGLDSFEAEFYLDNGYLKYE